MQPMIRSLPWTDPSTTLTTRLIPRRRLPSAIAILKSTVVRFAILQLSFASIWDLSILRLALTRRIISATTENAGYISAHVRLRNNPEGTDQSIVADVAGD